VEPRVAPQFTATSRPEVHSGHYHGGATRGSTRLPSATGICIYVYVCMYVCIHICMHVCMFVCMYVCHSSMSLWHTYIHTYIHTFMYTYIHTYIHTYMYIQIPVADGSLVEPRVAVMKGKRKDFTQEMEQLTVRCVCIYMYIYIYIYIYICSARTSLKRWSNWLWVDIFVCVYIHVYKYIHAKTNLYAMWMFIHTYVYTYIHTARSAATRRPVHCLPMSVQKLSGTYYDRYVYVYICILYIHTYSKKRCNSSDCPWYSKSCLTRTSKAICILIHTFICIYICVYLHTYVYTCTHTARSAATHRTVHGTPMSVRKLPDTYREGFGHTKTH
jgi:hypothetical protein